MKSLLFSFFCLLNIFAMAQEKKVESSAYNAMLSTLLSHSVKEVSVKEAADEQGEVLFLDSRSPEEYKVSHIKDARWVGYDDFDMERVKDIPKNRKIIVYCSVGARSEKITGKLKKAGYTDVANLYGGIFEWINEDHPVYNDSGKTDKIHPYNFFWGMWLSEGTKDYGN